MFNSNRNRGSVKTRELLQFFQPRIDPSAVAEEKEEDPFFAPPNEAFLQAKHYTPLNKDNQEIRLVQILPGETGEPLRCRLLEPVSLNRDEPLMALSYCAGDVRDLTDIEVNGTKFSIFTSLASALTQLRSSAFVKRMNPAMTLWIDQICINQYDTHEKSSQVLMMRHVYSRSVATMVFLDLNWRPYTSLEDLVGFIYRVRARVDQLAPSFVEDVSQLTETVYYSNMESGRQKDTLMALDRLYVNLANDLCREIYAGGGVKELTWLPTFAEIWTASYWSRCWVQQELVVSPSVWVLIGNDVVPWQPLLQAVDIVPQIARAIHRPGIQLLSDEEARRAVEPVLHLFMNRARSPASTATLEAKWKHHGGLKLRNLMNIARQLDSTDPRDKIYSMIGLAEEGYDIVVDYSPQYHVSTLLIDVAIAILGKDNSLSLLADANEIHRHVEWNLPSWVPDYTVPRGRQALSGSSDPRGKMPDYCATKNLGNNLSLSHFFSRSSGAQFTVVVEFNIYIKWQPFTGDELFEYRKDDDHPWQRACDIFSERTGSNKYQPNPDVVLCDAYNSTVTWGMDPKARQNLLNTSQSRAADHQSSTTSTLDDETYQVLTDHVVSSIGEAQSGKYLFFLTNTHGIMGLVPSNTEVGDQLCIIPGQSLPFVIRAVPSHGDDVETECSQNSDNFTLVGPAYVEGYMTGRAVDEIEAGLWTEKRITLY